MASKNLSNVNRGLWAEQIVHDFCIQKKWFIFSKRTKYKFGEIDLIVSRGHHIAVIEIKFLHHEWMAFERIQSNQLSKIQKNYIYLSQSIFKTKKVKLFLCFVNSNKKITWICLSDE